MIESLKRFLLLTGTLGRGRYLLIGVTLFLVKYALDSTVAAAFGRTWSPRNYLIWPDREAVLVFQLPDADRRFGLAMLAVALPFIWVGATLTLQRLRDARLPLGLVVLFFIPVVNLLLILGLCLVPSRPPEVAPPPGPVLATRARAVHRKVAGESSPAAFLLACVLSAAVTVGLVFVSANVLRSYGFGVFVAAPFVQGWLAAVLYGLPRRRSVGECLGVAVVGLAMAGVVLVAVAIEGLICILMAAPIALVLGLLGGLVGCAVQSRPWANDTAPAMVLGLVVALPSLMAAESVAAPEPAVREVRTAVVVDAPPDRVWGYVIAFPPLAEPTDPVFRTGIAYPRRAEIRGRGLGAVRHCVFSTGAFVEPIEVWDEYRCLGFRVTAQPPPMEELSPFHIHPPHLDNFLISHRGQFRLEPLPDGRTRREGTTWYTNRMWPADYWGLWADAIIHRIHRRVLDHVRELAEADHRVGDRRPPTPNLGRAWRSTADRTIGVGGSVAAGVLSWWRERVLSGRTKRSDLTARFHIRRVGADRRSNTSIENRLIRPRRSSACMFDPA
jgi:hypothetical protein